MEIISHRGYWKTASEKNNPIAFERSFKLGFGTETDLRDYLGQVVISHDIATADNITLDGMLEIYIKWNPTVLALNIKADGLQNILKSKLEEHAISNYFVFDMSIPDTIGYLNTGLKFFSRQSEYELVPAFYEQCDGIWLDAFKGEWYDNEVVEGHIRNKKRVALVSSDLHKRDVMPLWEMIKKTGLNKIDNIILCTDIPEDAVAYFN